MVLMGAMRMWVGGMVVFFNRGGDVVVDDGMVVAADDDDVLLWGFWGLIVWIFRVEKGVKR